MTPDEILDEMKSQVTREKAARMYAGGLLPAFCEFFLDLDTPSTPFASLEDFFKVHTQVEGDGERNINTLKVRPNGATTGRPKSIRSTYNAVERFYISESRRYDYKKQPAHATGQWRDYMRWLDSLVGFDRATLQDLSRRAKEFMLSTLDEHVVEASHVMERPPAFLNLIQNFPWNEKARGEAPGAAFQAMVFAFLRAEMPHLQVETRKLHAASTRAQGVGDVDAWAGRRLSVTAEVKHFRFTAKHFEELAQFVHNANERGASAWIVADSFAEGARAVVEAANLIAVDTADLVRLVRMWDIAKEQAAMNAFDWAVVQKERSIGLTKRYDAFIETAA